MALEDILKRIEQKNKKDIAGIKKEADKKCKAIDKEAEKAIKELDKENEKEVKEKTSKLREHMLQEARLKIAQELLKTKSNILNEVFKESLKRLENLSAKDYLAWMEKMLMRVAEPGESEVILPKNFKKKQDIKESLKDINEKLKGKRHIKLSRETRNIGAGFILKQSRKEINCSFQSLLEEKIDSLRVQTSRLLFGQKSEG